MKQALNCLRIFAILGLAAIFSTPVDALSLAEQKELCARSGTSPGRAIESCTAVILSGREASKDLARDYFNRGSAYFRDRKYEKALQDHDVAIRLDPRNGNYV